MIAQPHYLIVSYGFPTNEEAHEVWVKCEDHFADIEPSPNTSVWNLKNPEDGACVVAGITGRVEYAKALAQLMDTPTSYPVTLHPGNVDQLIARRARSALEAMGRGEDKVDIRQTQLRQKLNDDGTLSPYHGPIK
jgi:hypothetical protein